MYTAVEVFLVLQKVSSKITFSGKKDSRIFIVKV